MLMSFLTMMFANKYKEIITSEDSNRKKDNVNENVYEKRQRVCTRQKDLFAYAAELGYDPKTFTNEYLRSKTCEKMPFTFSHTELPSIFTEKIIPKIGAKLTKVENADVDLAGYVGYMYRYLYLITPYTNRELVEKVPFDKIANSMSDVSIKGEHSVAEALCAKNNLKFYETQNGDLI